MIYPTRHEVEDMALETYHSTARRNQGERLLVDPGAHDSLMGSEFVERMESLLQDVQREHPHQEVQTV